VLSLTPTDGGSEFVSTSLDQTVSVWNSSDGKLRSSLPGAQEPIACAAYLPESGDLITGSTANRLAVRHGLTAESAFVSNRARSDVLKGNLTSMRALEMNRMLLLGQDNGQIVLIC
jgi:WD repeat-containing protein 81